MMSELEQRLREEYDWKPGECICSRELSALTCTPSQRTQCTLLLVAVLAMVFAFAALVVWLNKRFGRD